LQLNVVWRKEHPGTALPLPHQWHSDDPNESTSVQKCSHVYISSQ